jgi:hypothetical protein
MAIATLRMKAMRQRSEVMISLQLAENLSHNRKTGGTRRRLRFTMNTMIR